jgi:hypothetical protein
MPKALFASKPSDLSDIPPGILSDDEDEAVEYTVREVVQMTREQYDALVGNFFADQPWLATPKGGVRNGAVQAIEVQAPGRPSLLVNPEGFTYPRYVAYK